MIDPKKYIRVFGGPGMPFITSYLFTYHYREVNLLITWKDNIWTAFLKKEIFEKVLDKGVEFYSDRQNFLMLLDDYEHHFNESIPYFEKIARKDSLTRQEVGKLFEHMGQTLSLYVKLEFFYTNRAFEKANTHPVLKQNVEEFDRLKRPGKEQIIRVYFDEHSYIYKLLAILSKQFSVSFEDLVSYNPFEVIALFDGKRVEKEELKKRRKFHILKEENGEVELLYEPKYEAIIDEMVPKIEPQKVLKGVIANKGTYTGKVKLFNHGYEFYKVKKLTEEMNEGDVLVTETTSPELTVACHKAGAIVTNEGGLLSHAAIIAREMNKPCIVGAHGITSSVKDGDLVEVDANKGIIRKLK